MVYGPPGPVSVKSPFWMVLQRIFSEKLNVSCEEPHVVADVNPVICGGMLSKMTAEDAPKLMV
jgi:hypothetical protein